MIYVTCKYAPLELFAGFGEEAERLDPHPVSFDCAESCGHPNLCSFVKAVIEEVYSREINELVLTDCCDSTRRLYDILKRSGKVDFIWFLPFPHKHGRRETAMFEKELRKLSDAYAEYSGRAFDEEKAVKDFIRRQQEFDKRPHAPYIRLTGAHGGSCLLEKIKEAFGDIPVADDTCTGTRYLSSQPEECEDFFSWYAEALLEQEMGCFRMWKNGGRNPENADFPEGTIFHTIKFCDYYSFEYMLEKEELAGAVLKIETDTTDRSSGQLKTRLEAFREEITGAKTGEVRMTDKKHIYAAGIDSGSASTDAVIMDENRKIIGSSVVPTGGGAADGARKALQEALEKAGISQDEISACVTTGYGRDTAGIPSRSITEISCHAKGAHYLNPDARTVIDIGGQDSKIICIDENGSVCNFVMNDKCAAGTGRFLEMQARALGLSMEDMSRLGLSWQNDLAISSMCTVFAESEVVSLVAANQPAGDIIHALNKAVAGKTASLMARLNTQEGYIMTGGVARNEGVVKAIEERIGKSVYVSEDSQICGAAGAALFALESIVKI